MSNPTRVDDPELQRKIDALVTEHEAEKKDAEKDDGDIRYVFSRVISDRNPGSDVKVRNGLDEENAGGTIVRKVGRGYLVRIGRYGIEVVVYEPEDSWV